MNDPIVSKSQQKRVAAMTHRPTGPRVPLALDAANFDRGQVEVMKSMRQCDEAIDRKLNSIDQVGHVPGVNSLLD